MTWFRRLFAGGLIVIGAISLTVAACISLALFDDVGDWGFATGYGVGRPSQAGMMVHVSILGCVFLSIGAALVWIGVRELLACRK